MDPKILSVLKRLDELEKLVALVNKTEKQGVEEGSDGQLTRVNSEEEDPEKLVLYKRDGFLIFAKKGYMGPICQECHMPPLPHCKHGTVGIDPETREEQKDITGRKSAFNMCPQKKIWRNYLEPKAFVSTGETELRDPEPVVSDLSIFVNRVPTKKG